MDIPALSPSSAERLLHGHIGAERHSWSVLKASGEGLRDYLQGQITQDITKLKPAQGIHACLLTPQGKAQSELYILQGHGEELILLVPAPLAVDTVDRLRRFALGYRLRIGIVDSMAVWSLQGTHADAQLEKLGLEASGDSWLACSRAADGTQELFALQMPRQPRGFWLVGLKTQLAALIADPVGEEQFEALRIIRGLPRLGVEWDSGLHPLNANMVEFDAVSFDKGCYVGQEVTSRMHWRGGIRKKLYRVQLTDTTNGQAPALPCPVFTTNRIGDIMSLAYDQQGQCFGIALLPIATADEVLAGKQALHLADGQSVTLLEPCHA